MPVPDLDARAVSRPPPRAARPKPSEPAAPLELAVDPRALVEERYSRPPAAMGAAPSASFPPPPQPSTLAPPLAATSVAPRRASLAPRGSLEPSDPLGDARVLADYPAPPGNLALSPLYAWKVIQRQRRLRAALAERKAEADHAQTALDDALVAFAERTRPALLDRKDYAQPLDALTAAEATLRSRDQVLAAEQDAQRTRLAQVDGRVAKAEAELALAQGEERAVATELAGVQSALAREEAKLKRAQQELRASQERAAQGAAG